MALPLPTMDETTSSFLSMLHSALAVWRCGFVHSKYRKKREQNPWRPNKNKQFVSHWLAFVYFADVPPSSVQFTLLTRIRNQVQCSVPHTHSVSIELAYFPHIDDDLQCILIHNKYVQIITQLYTLVLYHWQWVRIRKLNDWSQPVSACDEWSSVSKCVHMVSDGVNNGR